MGSRRNDTNLFLVGEMRVGELRVGEMRRHPYAQCMLTDRKESGTKAAE